MNLTKSNKIIKVFQYLSTFNLKEGVSIMKNNLKKTLLLKLKQSQFKGTGFLATFLLFSAIAASAQDAITTMNKVDSVLNAFKDQSMTVQLLLIDKGGKQSERELKMLQKGSDRRLVKFTSPADQKGIAFLSLPNDVMYLYLPAFGKTRRIASHVKNGKFAGTDFTYEDMEAKKYSEKWIPGLEKTESDVIILKLLPQKDAQTDYSQLLLTVRKDNYYPTKIEHFNKGGKLCKILTRTGIEKVNGYWYAKESEMNDLTAEHKTKMIIKETVFDSKLGEDLFTERYLTR